MQPEAKKVWVDALRSGEYKQARSQLCTPDGKMCCLGVLIDVAVDTNWVETTVKEYPTGFSISTGWGIAGKDEFSTYLAENSLPQNLLKRFGISETEEADLINLNDTKRWNFGRIATWIERNL